MVPVVGTFVAPSPGDVGTGAVGHVAVIVMNTTPSSNPPLPSATLYPNVSEPLALVLAVYVQSPPGVQETVPCAPCVNRETSSGSPSGSVSFARTLMTTDRPAPTPALSSTAT